MPTIWKPDFVSTYFPPLNELTEDELQSARDRLESYLRVGWPDVDFRPNSPLGDLALTPFAHLLAAMERGVGRFMSDLDLENVGAGTIYNCDFVRAFLANFAVYDQATLQSTGVVRLILNEDKAYTIDRRMRFQFGDNTFSLRLDFPGHLDIKPVGEVPTVNANSIALSDIGNGLYAVEVWVRGTMGAVVTQNDTADVDITIAELVSATAVVDFEAGAPETSLSVLAKKTRERFHGPALSGRASAVNFVYREFPESLKASAVLPGDAIMLRASVNPLGISEPKVDLHVRSKQFDFAASQVIRIEYVESQDAVTVNKFITKLDVVGHPTLITRLTSLDNAEISFIPGQTLDVFSRSNNPAKAPLLTAAGTAYEDLWLAFDMPRDSAGSEMLTTTTEGGKRYAFFTIEYRYDPLFGAIAARVDSPDVKPAGVDLMARPFVPIVISKFEVTYTKHAGKTMKLDAAREEIFQYLRQIGYPSNFSVAKIGDSMFYAGAEDMKSVGVAAKVWWSAANKVLPADVAAPDVDYAEAEDEALAVPSVSASNADALTIDQFIDPLLGTADETMAAIGIHNSCYILDRATIAFSEHLR